jgi:hypothetical protein
VLFINACSQQTTIEFGKYYNHVALKSDTTLSYSIYIPENNPVNHKLVFIFFDPHGSGELPVSMYKNLADEFGVTLIGNNNSANGKDFSSIHTDFTTLLNELKSTYNINEKDIALWGFSGGAKAAIYNAGFNNNIVYCVYGGSVIKPENDMELLGFNGKQDMNYTDLLIFSKQEQNNPKHFQIEFAGKHAWPDTITAKDAFRWLLLKKMQKKEISLNKTFVSKSLSIYKKQVDNLMQTKQYMDAFFVCNKSIHLLNSITDISYFNTKKTFITAQPLFKKQVTDLQASLIKETQFKNQYQIDFLTKDTLYWKKEIKHLWLIAKTDKSGIYNRLLGFLSLASYTYANHAFQANDLKALEQILFIYQHSDPANPEQAFMRAKLYVLKNENEQAKITLKEAINLGIDKNRIIKDALLKDLQ